MEIDPYAPPQATLEDVSPPSATRGEWIPFENKADFPSFGQRILETFRWIFSEQERAGAGFRDGDALGAPIGFICLLGYLPAVIPGLLGALWPRQPFWMAWMHLPAPRPAEGFLLLIPIVSIVVFAPVGLILGGLVGGLLNHAGLWLVRGTKQGHGLVATLRSTLYTAAALSWIIFPLNLAKSIPGFPGQVFEALALLVAVLLPASYQGYMLSRVHRVETWRGVLGAWVPGLAALFCLGTCAGLAYWFAGDAIREMLKQARPGMF